MLTRKQKYMFWVWLYDATGHFNRSRVQTCQSNHIIYPTYSLKIIDLYYPSIRANGIFLYTRYWGQLYFVFYSLFRGTLIKWLDKRKSMVKQFIDVNVNFSYKKLHPHKSREYSKIWIVNISARYVLIIYLNYF